LNRYKDVVANIESNPKTKKKPIHKSTKEISQKLKSAK
jgi:hypothetical protein